MEQSGQQSASPSASLASRKLLSSMLGYVWGILRWPRTEARQSVNSSRKESPPVVEEQPLVKVSLSLQSPPLESGLPEESISGQPLSQIPPQESVALPTETPPPVKKQQPMIASFLKSLSLDCPPEIRHPEAVRFINNFEENKDCLAHLLFHVYNTIVFGSKLPADLPIVWNSRLLSTAGYTCCCNADQWSRKRYCIVKLSEALCNTPERLRDILIHELCHVAVWLVDRVLDMTHPHGSRWKRWASQANTSLKDLPPVVPLHDYIINYRYIYLCLKCGYREGRHIKSLDVRIDTCEECGGRLKMMVQHDNGQPGAVNRLSSASFDQFVQRRYSRLKGQTKLKHADLIKRLREEYERAKKVEKESNVCQYSATTETPAPNDAEPMEPGDSSVVKITSSGSMDNATEIIDQQEKSDQAQFAAFENRETSLLLRTASEKLMQVSPEQTLQDRLDQQEGGEETEMDKDSRSPAQSVNATKGQVMRATSDVCFLHSPRPSRNKGTDVMQPREDNSGLPQAQETNDA